MNALLLNFFLEVICCIFCVVCQVFGAYQILSIYFTFQLIFIAEIGDGHLGDIAIDDVQVFYGACDPSTPPPPCIFFCDNGNCLNDINLVCNFENDCGDQSDENECGMYSL